MQRETSTDRQRIIELFARRQPTYAGADVVRLLGLSEEQLATSIASGAVSTETNETGERVIPWEEVALLALQEWTPRMIEAALGHQANDIIPLLNQHRLIRVSLPIYLIRLLDHLAREESRAHPRNASDALEEILTDAVDDSTTIEEAIPGFAQAHRYPYFTPRRTGLLWLRCRYCDIAISQPGREVCRACEHHHEPNEHLGQYGLPELEEPDGSDETEPAPTPRRHERRTHPAKRRRRPRTRRK